MASHNLTEYQEVATSAAKRAGEVIRAAWNNPRNVMHKGNVDLVTETDQQCEQIVMHLIKNQYPSHKFIGEEESAANGSTPALTDEPTWMIDPLDGTTNFVHKFPFVCVCIGLAIDKKVVVGVVFNPILNELFVATRGGGAFCNGQLIAVSGEQTLSKALVATEIGITRDDETVSAIFDRVQSTVSSSRSLRCTGSCAMNMVSVAIGRLDVFFEIGFGGPWDVAAASVIVEEAGGIVLDPCGAAFDVMSRRVLAGTPIVAMELGELLSKCRISGAEPGPPTAHSV